MIDMQCMLQISPTRLLMGGHQEKIIDFNLTRGKETGLVSFYEYNEISRTCIIQACICTVVVSRYT